MKPTVLSKYLNSGRSIWFIGDKPTKNSFIRVVLVFEKGKVTTYDVNPSEFTYASLRGMSDNELLPKLKSSAREEFAQQNKKREDDVNKTIQSLEREINDPNEKACVAVGDQQDYDLYGAHYEASAADPGCKRELSDLKVSLTNIEMSKFKNPEPQPFSLSITTDDTGNTTTYETLHFTANQLLFTHDGKLREDDGDKKDTDHHSYGMFTNKEGDECPDSGICRKGQAFYDTPKWKQGDRVMGFAGASGAYPVYDKTFYGFYNSKDKSEDDRTYALQMLSKGQSFTMPSFDGPDSKGVKIDS